MMLGGIHVTDMISALLLPTACLFLSSYASLVLDTSAINTEEAQFNEVDCSAECNGSQQPMDRCRFHGRYIVPVQLTFAGPLCRISVNHRHPPSISVLLSSLAQVQIDLSVPQVQGNADTHAGQIHNHSLGHRVCHPKILVHQGVTHGQNGALQEQGRQLHLRPITR